MKKKPWPAFASTVVSSNFGLPLEVYELSLHHNFLKLVSHASPSWGRLRATTRNLHRILANKMKCWWIIHQPFILFAKIRCKFLVVAGLKFCIILVVTKQFSQSLPKPRDRFIYQRDKLFTRIWKIWPIIFDCTWLHIPKYVWEW